MNADQINEAYINGNTEEDTWTKELQGVNHKLNVLGLEMTLRPWEGKRNATGF
jgi:hypothetical protein